MKNAVVSVTVGTKLLKTDLLSPEEEIELSKRIRAGEDAKITLSSHSDGLTEPEIRALQAVINDGEQAYQQLVLANLPRVSKIAAQTMRKNPHSLNEFEDYRQAAMKAICVCARSFDWRKGCRFGTYVHRSLQNEMMRENARTCYATQIPEETLPLLGKLRRMTETMSVTAAAEELGIGKKDAEELLATGKHCRSLQDPVSDKDPDTELEDLIEDGNAMTAEEIDASIDLTEKLHSLAKALATLPDEEQNLLKARMGYDGQKPLPMKAFIGIVAQSTSGVQKKQLAAQKHLREAYLSLPMAD